ncbi:MAG TPA: hypothetical protein VK599_09075 [Streptosporangiaceae bacterium]|nr:hypothetical protein [Streptosporangiaceae bacterium]
MGGRARTYAIVIMAASAIGLGVTVAAPAGAQAAAASPAVCVSAAHPLLAARMSGGIAAALHGRRSAVGLAVADPSLGLSSGSTRAATSSRPARSRSRSCPPCC